jgi:hypothetical protein
MANYFALTCFVFSMRVPWSAVIHQYSETVSCFDKGEPEANVKVLLSVLSQMWAVASMFACYMEPSMYQTNKDIKERKPLLVPHETENMFHSCIRKNHPIIFAKTQVSKRLI